MPIELDFTQIKDDNYIAPGIYSAYVTNVEHRDSRSGYPTLSISFIITDDRYDGRRAYYSMSLLPHAMQYTRRALLALGIPIEQLQGTPTLEPTELIGRECQLYFTYARGDVAQTKVDTIYPPKQVETVETPIVVPF